jgi:MFS family permease
LDKNKIESTNKNNKNYVFFLINSFLSLIIVGIFITIFAPILIEISNSYKVAIADLGLIFSINSFGFVSGYLFNIFAHSKLKTKYGFHIFYFIFFISTLSIFIIKLSLTLYIAVFFIAFCASYIQVNVLHICSEVKKDKGFLLSMATFFGAFGASIGTIIGPLFIKSGYSWNLIFLIISIIIFLIFIFSFIEKFPILEITESENSFKNIFSFKKIKKYRKNLGIIIFLLAIFGGFIFIAIENNLSSWMPTLFRTLKNFDIRLAGGLTGIFWISLAAGRLIISFVNKKFNIYKSSILLIVLFIIALAATFLINNSILAIIFFGISGIFLACIFPNSLIIATQFVKDKKNLAISIFLINGYAGSALFNLLIMKTIKIMDIGFIIFIYYFLSLNLLITFITIFLINRLKLKKKEVIN